MHPSNFDRLLADAFRRRSWRVHRRQSENDSHPDLIVESGSTKYVIAMKQASEGRRDRLIPLLAQAILEAQLYARQVSKEAVPVAVISAEHIPLSVADAAREFALRFAPQVGVGVIDADGMRSFSGHGLEILNANPAGKDRQTRRQIANRRLPHLFSDLNQWMLKVLLSEAIPSDLLSAPRTRIRNASELARAAHVSVMSASRFLRQLGSEGFVERSEMRISLVRVPELLRRWAATREPVHEFPVRWIIKRDPGAVSSSLRTYASQAPSIGTASEQTPSPRACLALFAAADALGLGFVHGVPPYLYLERHDPKVLERIGFSAERADQNPDAFIRIPASTESVFRAAVMKDGVPATDILQAWLDLSAHPARGKAQADQIERRVLSALFKRR